MVAAGAAVAEPVTLTRRMILSAGIEVKSLELERELMPIICRGDDWLRLAGAGTMVQVARSGMSALPFAGLGSKPAYVYVVVHVHERSPCKQSVCTLSVCAAPCCESIDGLWGGAARGAEPRAARP